MRHVLIPAALLALPVTAHAETADDQTIVVTGQGLQRTAEDSIYGVQVIGRDRFDSAASGRLEDVLASAAGFQQFRRSDSRSANPSAQGVTFRGLGGNASSRTLILLDGVPQADPFFGYIPFAGIAPERLSRVLVTRGGGSGAFGAGAVAGTIEMVSAGADELDLLGASALVNDRGESELTATLAPELGQGFAVLSGRWDRGQGFWTTPATQRVAASTRARYESWSAGLRAVAPLTDSVELQVRGLVYDDQRTLRFTGADSGTRGQDASVRLVGRGDWQFDALAYVQARDFSNIVISSTSFRNTLDQRRTPATGIGGKLELRPPVGGGHEVRLGADWRSMTGRTQEEAYSGVTGLVTARRRAGGAQHRSGAVRRGQLDAGRGDADRGPARRSLDDPGRLFHRGERCRDDDRQQRVCRPGGLGRQLARRGAGAGGGGRCPAGCGLYQSAPADPERAVSALHRVPRHHPRQRGLAQRGTAGVRSGRGPDPGGGRDAEPDRVRQQGEERHCQCHHRHQLA